MKNFILIIFSIIVFVVQIIFVAKFSTPENDWICKDGQWIKHGNPSAQMPIKSCK